MLSHCYPLISVCVGRARVLLLSSQGFGCFVIYSPLQVNGVVAAEFELEHLLLEGHCFDLSTGQPPRGLQFTLGMSQDPLMYDTIVMANLVSILARFFALCWEDQI